MIAAQFDRVRKWGNGDKHQVSIVPVLADPFARNDLGSGTDVMQLRDEIAETLWEFSATKLPDVCRALGLEDGDVDEAMASKRAYVRSRTSDYTLDGQVPVAMKPSTERRSPAASRPCQRSWSSAVP
ncbi:hypothetical protein [Micromonospora sp. DT31]|uniref:hypothetical protein n=1 Tax=Micromonospora sp. DT31 TaxID=3393434 RepID=UPI003CE9EFFC